ncbi:MAG TPA: serine/threonine-protein kinase [Polyangiaceae bacterium]|nr:serine/threonine-protein kinase [Polyangiaceae bacterium]
MDDTLLQFGRAVGREAEPEPATRVKATLCPRCTHHFSPDGRFCPFDGEPLQPSPDWDPGADALIGSLVDSRYEVLSVLGEGGMGIVYEIRHRALGKRFALKALRKDLATDGEIAARFMQEARTAASVSHPGLVEITDFGQLPSGQPFFVMELLEGQSLSTMIRRGGPMPAARAVDIIRQIAEALGAAHERSIIHRDLKPDNIHISVAEGGRDRVTIVDFGLAKVIGTSRLTRAGMVFGTPHYMSPEQAMGEVTDHRADVYALGVVMYEMFTGRVPFEADSYMGVLTKHMYMAPTPPSHLPGTSELGALEAILLRCLEKRADQRYATLRDLIADLDRVLLVAGEPASRPRSRPRASRSVLADELELPTREELELGRDGAIHKPKAWWPLGVVGALFVAGIGVVLALRSATSPSSDLARSSSVSLPSSPPDSALRGASTAAPLPEISSTTATAMPAPPAASAASEIPAQSSLRKTSLPPHRTPTVPATTRKKVAPLGGSEIVDPWSKGGAR